MSAHTPGPWLAMRGTESTGRQVTDWAITVEKGYAWICTGPSWDDEFQEESFANAHLIAAAPDLLEALEAIEGCYQCGNDLNIVMDQVRVAIAKAKGEPHA